MYHVSSSPVHDTVSGTSASPTNSLIPTPSGFAPPSLREDANYDHFQIATPFSELPSQTSRLTADRPSPGAELVLGPSARASGGGSKWRDRTADWVEMVERSGFAGLRGGGGGEAGMGNSLNPNPHFRRTSSFNDTTPQPRSSGHCRPFRERSLTQVNYPDVFMRSHVFMYRGSYFLINRDYALFIFRLDRAPFPKEVAGTKEAGSRAARTPSQSTGPSSGRNPDPR